MEKRDIQPDAVESISVLTGSNVINPGLLRILHAHNELEAKFCFAFQMASIVLQRKAGLSEFGNDFVQSPECQELQKKVEVATDPEIDALGKGRIVSKITLTTKEGQIYFEESDPLYRGGPKNPLTWEEVSEKFKDASQHVLSTDKAEAFLALAKDFEKLPNLKDIIDTVTA